jgi:hypothetical protein
MGKTIQAPTARIAAVLNFARRRARRRIKEGCRVFMETTFASETEMSADRLVPPTRPLNTRRHLAFDDNIP